MSASEKRLSSGLFFYPKTASGVFGPPARLAPGLIASKPADRIGKTPSSTAKTHRAVEFG